MNTKFDTEDNWKWQLLFVLFVAIIMRLIFYTGVFGSDDMAYNRAALNFLNGEPEHATYVGLLRYGINIPVAFFFTVFGVNEFSANIWSFLCSMGEVVLVYLFTKLAFTKRTALIAAFLLATLPIHVHYTGRMIADNPLSFFIALSFYFFVLAEKTNSAKYFLFAGLAFGFTYWLKSSVTVLFAPIFVIYALSLQQYNKNWNFFIIGGVALWVSHFMLMWGLHGNPLQLIDSKVIAMGNHSIESSATSAGFYLGKLLVDIKYTWLLGPLAILGMILLRKKLLIKENRLLIIWGCWSLIVLSLISLRQNNYMLLFCFPLCIFAAHFLSSFKWYLWTLIWLPAAIVLTGLKQQDIRNFTSNSQALSQSIFRSPGLLFVGSKRSVNIHSENSLLQGLNDADMNVFTLDKSLLNSEFMTNTQQNTAIISVDEETLNLADAKLLKSYIKLNQSCIKTLPAIEPQGFGLGLVILKGIITTIDLVLPHSITERVVPYLKSYTRPKPMRLYEADLNCIRE